jgi:hypothetical protein
MKHRKMLVKRHASHWSKGRRAGETLHGPTTCEKECGLNQHHLTPPPIRIGIRIPHHCPRRHCIFIVNALTNPAYKRQGTKLFRRWFPTFIMLHGFCIPMATRLQQEGLPTRLLCSRSIDSGACRGLCHCGMFVCILQATSISFCAACSDAISISYVSATPRSRYDSPHRLEENWSGNPGTFPFHTSLQWISGIGPDPGR